ncbi:hypothetical protein [Streptomyces sp. NPDC059010]|uniref:hypothetical protein n=1 Tax=Streptomyces sp. NPDC059010 TaxID=3346695 RepID=UPI0036D1A612
MEAGADPGAVTEADPGADTGTDTMATCCPPMLTLPARSSSASSKYGSASSIPIVSPGFAVPSPPVSTPAIR